MVKHGKAMSEARFFWPCSQKSHMDPYDLAWFCHPRAPGTFCVAKRPCGNLGLSAPQAKLSKIFEVQKTSLQKHNGEEIKFSDNYDDNSIKFDKK